MGQYAKVLMGQYAKVLSEWLEHHEGDRRKHA
jgi:hypothetical protein